MSLESEKYIHLIGTRAAGDQGYKSALGGGSVLWDCLVGCACTEPTPIGF